MASCNYIFLFVILLQINFSLSQSNNDGFWDFIPIWKATLGMGSVPSTWNAPCFQSNTAKLVKADAKGATIEVDAEQSTSYFCTDLYMFATNQNWHVRDFLVHGKREITFEWRSAEEYVYFKQYGIQVFYVPGGALGFVEDLVATLELFVGPNEELDIVKFFHDYMNVTLQPRAQFMVNLTQSDIMSGDYLAILKMDGTHGGMNSMECFGSGSRIGHVAMALWMNGELFVVESTENPSGEDSGVIKTPWEQWFTDAAHQRYNVDLLRLSEKSRAKFDVNKAIAFFEESAGLPYGFHNFIFGWIDTKNDNYPPPASAQIFPMFFQIVDYVDPFYSSKLWGEALNKRLNTSGLAVLDLFETMEERNMSFYDVMTFPEQDEWVYSDGKSMVCSSFVMALYKAAGVFDDIPFQATELTPLDSYSLNIYEQNWQRPAPCLVDDLPYCQLLGDYILELGSSYNTLDPYPNMFQHCGGLPPDYVRKPGC